MSASVTLNNRAELLIGRVRVARLKTTARLSRPGTTIGAVFITATVIDLGSLGLVYLPRA